MIAQSSSNRTGKLPRRERQRHECPAPANLLLPIIFAPVPRKSGNPVVGSFIAEAHQIGVQLLDRALLLARSAHLAPQPGRQMLSKWVSLLGRSGTLKRGSIVSDRKYLRIVLRDSPCAPRNLPDR
jgi:hypothetical protein